jgi:hypothetical protein
MKEKLLFGVICGLLFARPAFGILMTEIDYTVADLGSNHWQYTYEVKNIGLVDPVKEFTIWFDYSLYENLVITTPKPLSDNWNEIVWQPEKGLGAGGYDALALNLGIGKGESLNGLAVTFDWLSQGTPSSQYYEIVVPNTSPMQVIDSGWTVPEPATLLLFGLGGLALLKNRRG